MVWDTRRNGAKEALTRWGAAAFGRLPAPVRRWAVRVGTPNYTVGAVCVLRRDERVLLLCQRHRPDWSFPGGLLGRGEDPATAVVREVREETGLQIEVDQPVTAVVVPEYRRVDIVYVVDVDDRSAVDVVPAGEAKYAAWKHPAELGEGEDIAKSILAAVDRSTRGGATRGRLR